MKVHVQLFFSHSFVTPLMSYLEGAGCCVQPSCFLLGGMAFSGLENICTATQLLNHFEVSTSSLCSFAGYQ